MKPFSELFTNNFFGITFVAFICTQSIENGYNQRNRILTFLDFAYLYKDKENKIEIKL